MEIQFQNQKGVIPVSKGGRCKLRNGANKNNRFVGVRQRPSGRWVAEIKDTTQKIRMWLGTFETAEEAARAYDEAACLLRGSNTRTNFVTRVSANSPLASRIKNILNTRKGDNNNNNNNSTKKTIAKSSPSSSTSASAISRSSSNTSDYEVISVSTEKTIDTQLFDDAYKPDFSDAYKPDLSNCVDEFESGGSCEARNPWVGGFGNGFDRFEFNQELVNMQRNTVDSNETDVLDFDRMKVERQISASLYAMNGVNEYMETLNDSTEAFWDLPPLCSLMFR